MLQSNGDLGVGRVHTPCIREAKALCDRDVEMEAPLVVRGRTYINTVGCM